ncbi:hypothetical protein Rhe02_55020 [Rhizocola hellebori]|uniref:Uncharacterized protein n=1 Tax=Rhizocola hellebori TaxID=1392758 RepID=A0A8J3VIB5_9ACTN|nr:hypothetical protein [Rhizocola hellebori]GIH07435.1 hypothetical protein Rhe02_55020 [Rhizocola hellebori]
MRWPWSKRPKPENTEAVKQAQKRLDAAHAAEPEVSRVVRELRRIQIENNFAALLTSAFRDHR